MPAFLLLTAALAAAGVALLGAMYTQHDPYFGALGLMSLCSSGVTGAAYGVLNSAG